MKPEKRMFKVKARPIQSSAMPGVSSRILYISKLQNSLCYTRKLVFFMSSALTGEGRAAASAPSASRRRGRTKTCASQSSVDDQLADWDL